MIVLKATLESARKDFEARLRNQSELYESRVSDLKTQIEDLKKLVFAPPTASRIPLVALEADSIMSQREETIVMSPDEIARLEADESEANRLLSGNY